MLELILHRKAQKFLAQCPPKHQKQLKHAIQSLLSQPEPHDSAFLKGFPFRRQSVGEYRIIYDYDDAHLQIHRIGKRNDGEIYRDLSRM